MTAPAYLYKGCSRHIQDTHYFTFTSLCGVWCFDDEGMVADELASKRRGDPEQRIAHNRALPTCKTCQRIWDNANGGAS
jgi:hypothetical protein